MTCQNHQAGQSQLRLAGDEVHLWSFSFSPDERELAGLGQLLCRQESMRADRYRFQRDKDAFVFRRGSLRLILSRYVEADPSRLRYVLGPFGKPDLGPPFDAGRIRFNVAHSGGRVLIAVTRDCCIGVDVEQIRQELDVSELANHILSPAETEVFSSLAHADRPRTFFFAWALKEAYLKARGLGLIRSPDQVEVGLGTKQKPPRLVRDHCDAPATALWSLAELEPACNYAGALAMQGHLRRLRHFDTIPFF